MTKQFNVMHFDSKQFKKLMVFAQVLISPQFATDLLSLNTGNRPLKNGTLNKYTDDMKKGKWRYNGDIIQISKSGKLLNGQHRLNAIIQSGTTQMFNIQSGLEEDAFETIDIGKGRNDSDALAVKGFENQSILASLAKFVMQYEAGKLKYMSQGGAGSTTSNRISIHEVVVWAEKQDKDLLLECATAGHRLFKKFRVISSPTYAAFLFIFGKKNRQEAFEFFDLLVTGENIGSTSFSMIFLLRNKLINMSTGSTQLRTADKYALIIKAWNFFRKNKETKVLSWNSNTEDFLVAV